MKSPGESTSKHNTSSLHVPDFFYQPQLDGYNHELSVFDAQSKLIPQVTSRPADEPLL